MRGDELLAEARNLTEDRFIARFAYRSPGADEVLRPALVTCLLRAVAEQDAELVRAVTREQIRYVSESDIGCGDVLYACCGLLFRLGHLDDIPLIWQAKQINMDTGSMIDGAFLVPQGADATLQFADSRGLGEIKEYVAECRPYGDMEPQIGWAALEYFSQVPAMSESIESLASWLRS